MAPMKQLVVTQVCKIATSWRIRVVSFARKNNWSSFTMLIIGSHIAQTSKHSKLSNSSFTQILKWPLCDTMVDSCEGESFCCTKDATLVMLNPCHNSPRSSQFVNWTCIQKPKLTWRTHSLVVHCLFPMLHEWKHCAQVKKVNHQRLIQTGSGLAHLSCGH